MLKNVILILVAEKASSLRRETDIFPVEYFRNSKRVQSRAFMLVKKYLYIFTVLLWVEKRYDVRIARHKYIDVLG